MCYGQRHGLVALLLTTCRRLPSACARDGRLLARPPHPNHITIPGATDAARSFTVTLHRFPQDARPSNPPSAQQTQHLYLVYCFSTAAAPGTAWITTYTSLSRRPYNHQHATVCDKDTASSHRLLPYPLAGHFAPWPRVSWARHAGAVTRATAATAAAVADQPSAARAGLTSTLVLGPASALALGAVGRLGGGGVAAAWGGAGCCTTVGRIACAARAIATSSGAGSAADGGGGVSGGVAAGEALLSAGLESRLRQLHSRYTRLEAALAGSGGGSGGDGGGCDGGGGGSSGGGDGGGPMSQSALREAGREYSRLRPTAAAYERLLRVRQELSEVGPLLRDPDPGVRGLAVEEAEALRAEASALTRRLLLSLLPRDPRDGRPALLELRAGAGGMEAALFCGELLSMYHKLATSRGWSWQVLDIQPGDVGGVRHAYISVSDGNGNGGGGGASYGDGGDGGDCDASYGGGVYGTLAPESGVHRVQRVPVTDGMGRVHTSTAVVIVLAQADEIDVRIRPEDLRVETMRASGAGGQHVNVTDSAVRITHIPTGTTVSCQNERSQLANRAAAMQVLRSRLYEMEAQKREREVAAQRSALGGGGERGERVRTYNYPHGRVTDHRVGLTVHDLGSVMEAGEGLERLMAALRAAREEEALAGLAERETGNAAAAAAAGAGR